MSMSLRDQLLKAGLVNEKQAKQATKQKQKQQRLEHKNQVDKDDSQRLAAEQARAEKLARDQELNRQQQEKAEKKARPRRSSN
ncbi:nucleoprotein/polynucleotide-associated enzyme [Pseudomonas aeruginosa]|nr:nucleoprotein/polynucleotide-associated enzyme [Pseudomonas aeruginosa]